MTTTVADWMAEGEIISEETQMMLRARYGVDQPVQVQYLKWLRNILRGDLGVSWAWNKPIGTLIAERLPWSLLISSISLLFVYSVAIPVGVLAATISIRWRTMFLPLWDSSAWPYRTSCSRSYSSGSST